MSDGECNEGTVWEAAMFITGKKLKNIIALIDCNKWQATQRTNEILKIEPNDDLTEIASIYGGRRTDLNGTLYGHTRRRSKD